MAVPSYVGWSVVLALVVGGCATAVDRFQLANEGAPDAGGVDGSRGPTGGKANVGGAAGKKGGGGLGGSSGAAGSGRSAGGSAGSAAGTDEGNACPSDPQGNG